MNNFTLCLMSDISTLHVRRYIGWKGEHVGVNSFGASAPAPKLYEKFGITKDGVVQAAKKVLA